MKIVWTLEVDTITTMEEIESVANEYFKAPLDAAMTVEVDGRPVEMIASEGIWVAEDSEVAEA